MMSQTHMAGGVLFAAGGIAAAQAAGITHLPPEVIAPYLAWSVIAGDLPDIDHPASRISKGGVGFGALGVIFGAPARLVGALLRVPVVGVNHRGPTHSLVFLALWSLLAAPLYLGFFAACALVAGWLAREVGTVYGTHLDLETGQAAVWLLQQTPTIFPMAAFSTALGYLSHLVLDSFTNVPVPWLWPFSGRRFSLLPRGMRVTTGSHTEVYTVRPVVVVVAAWAAFTLACLPLIQQEVLRARSSAEAGVNQVRSDVRSTGEAIRRAGRAGP